MYSGNLFIFAQIWFYWANWLCLGKIGCNRVNWFYLGKIDGFLGKLVAFVQN